MAHRRPLTGGGFGTLVVFCLLSVRAAGDAASQPAMERSSGSWLDMPVAVLQGLDKITARVTTFAVDVGDSSRIGTLQVTVRACSKRPPTETPESAAFLEISDYRPGEAPVFLFGGWMFASSPALSALEHPVYDVWVIECRNAATSPPSSGSL